ncbi:hypothetical protein [Pseudorhodobacter ferrugineus]|nr:hypothetical protein [Pseudorhodobacter ferrugineus]
MDEAAERNRYSNLMWVYPYLYPFRLGSSKYSLLDSLRYYVYNDETATLPEIDPPQIPEALRTDFSPSFWRLADSYYDKMLVSKKPILAESYVFMRCRPELCDVLTLRPANGDNIPPPLRVYIQLWSPVLGKGEGAEELASYLQDLDKMLRLARSHPKER